MADTYSNVVEGLFGLQPFQVQQQQQTNIDAQANAYANQTPYQRAAGSMFKAGAGLAGAGAGMMGMVNSQMEQSSNQAASMRGLDTEDPKAIRKRALELMNSNPQQGLRLAALANFIEKRNSELKLQDAQAKYYRDRGMKAASSGDAVLFSAMQRADQQAARLAVLGRNATFAEQQSVSAFEKMKVIHDFLLTNPNHPNSAALKEEYDDYNNTYSKSDVSRFYPNGQTPAVAQPTSGQPQQLEQSVTESALPDAPVTSNIDGSPTFKGSAYEPIVKPGEGEDFVTSEHQTQNRAAIPQPVVPVQPVARPVQVPVQQTATPAYLGMGTKSQAAGDVERAKREADRDTAYSIKAEEEKAKRDYARDIAAEESRGRNVPQVLADAEAAKGAGAQGTEINKEQYAQVRESNNVIKKVFALEKHLKSSDAVTGMGADIITGFYRVQAMLGLTGNPSKKVSDTEILNAMMGSEVFTLLRSLGLASKNMDTPSEREFMRDVLTGRIQLNKTTLLEMARDRRHVAEQNIRQWNDRVKSGELDSWFEQTKIKKSVVVGGGLNWNPVTKRWE